MVDEADRKIHRKYTPQKYHSTEDITLSIFPKKFLSCNKFPFLYKLGVKTRLIIQIPHAFYNLPLILAQLGK